MHRGKKFKNIQTMTTPQMVEVVKGKVNYNVYKWRINYRIMTACTKEQLDIKGVWLQQHHSRDNTTCTHSNTELYVL